MPAHKDFKRLVRARMKKTGESYTAARAHFVAQPRTAPSAPVDYAKLAGMSDAAIKKETGCTWERWVTALDRHNAYDWTHREIAEYVQKKYKVRDWWCQTVTVGYERIKGLRQIGQRRDGSYEATKSKVFAAPLRRLYQAFADPRTRSRWLPDVTLVVRKATRDKSMRITWPDGSSVEALFYAKGAGRSQIAIQHRKLQAPSAAAEMTAFWTARLESLGEVIGT